jgi:hypothetical protein
MTRKGTSPPDEGMTIALYPALPDPWKLEALRLMANASATFHRLHQIALIFPESVACREMAKIIGGAMENLDTGRELLPLCSTLAPLDEGGES